MRQHDSAPVRLIQPGRDVDDGDDDFAVEGHKPQVPDNKYLARYLGHDTAILFGARAHKVFLRFEICEGEHQGVWLFRAYRARRVLKSGPSGKFVLSAGGDLYRMLVRVLDVRTRPDRISLRRLRTMLLAITTETVTKDRDGLELPPGAQYSIVKTIEDGS